MKDCIESSAEEILWCPLPSSLENLRPFSIENVENNPKLKVQLDTLVQSNSITTLCELWRIYQSIFLNYEEEYEAKVVVHNQNKGKYSLFVGEVRLIPLPNPKKYYVLFRTVQLPSIRRAEKGLCSLFENVFIAKDLMEILCNASGDGEVKSGPPPAFDMRDSLLDLNGQSLVGQALDLLSAALDLMKTANREERHDVAREIRRYEDPNASAFSVPNQNKTLTKEYKEVRERKRACAKSESLKKFCWSVSSKPTTIKSKFEPNGYLYLRYWFTVVLWQRVASAEDVVVKDGRPSNASLSTNEHFPCEVPVMEASWESMDKVEPLSQLFYRCVRKVAESLRCGTLMEELFREFCCSVNHENIHLAQQCEGELNSFFVDCSVGQLDGLLLSKALLEEHWKGDFVINLDKVEGILPKSDAVDVANHTCSCYGIGVKGKRDHFRYGVYKFWIENMSFVVNTVYKEVTTGRHTPEREYTVRSYLSHADCSLDGACVWTITLSWPHPDPEGHSMLMTLSKCFNAVNLEPVAKNLTGTENVKLLKTGEGTAKCWNDYLWSGKPLRITGDALKIFCRQGELDLSSRSLLLLLDFLWQPYYELAYTAEWLHKKAGECSNGVSSPLLLQDISQGMKHVEGLTTKEEVVSKRIRITLEVYRRSLPGACSPPTCHHLDVCHGSSSPSDSVISEGRKPIFLFEEEGTVPLTVWKRVLLKAWIVQLSYRKMIRNHS